MKKRICFLFAFLVVCVLAVLPNKVFAQDYWVYSDGKIDYYVMTETVDKKYDSYDLKIKYVYKQYAPDYRTMSVEYRAMLENRRAWKYKVWNANGSDYEPISRNNWSGAVWDYLCANYEK